jgi:trans-aconitate methyltransferase
MDHQPVLQGISRGLKPGGKALLQMGGQGNAARVVAAMDAVRARPEWCGYFKDFEFPYGFFGVGEYCQWLGEAGLTCGRVELIPKELVHPSRAAFEGWLRTTWLPYTQQVPVDRRQEFIDQVMDAYLESNPAAPDGAITVHMVRLEVETKKE